MLLEHHFRVWFHLKQTRRDVLQRVRDRQGDQPRRSGQTSFLSSCDSVEFSRPNIDELQETSERSDNARENEERNDARRLVIGDRDAN